MTAALIAAAVLLALALAVVWLLWRSATETVAAQARLIRHQCERIDGYRADLDALSIAGPPPVARAALTPDDPSLLPAEIEQWLRTRESR